MQCSQMLDTSLCAKESPPESKQTPVNRSKKKKKRQQLICHLQSQCNYSVQVRQNENNPEVPTTRESSAQAKSPSCARLHCVCSSTRLSIIKTFWEPTNMVVCFFFSKPNHSLAKCHTSESSSHYPELPSFMRFFLRKTFWCFVEQISHSSISFGS